MRARHGTKANVDRTTDTNVVSAEAKPQVSEAIQAEEPKPESKVPESKMRVRLPGAPPHTPSNANLIPMQDFDPDCIRELIELANKEQTEIVLEKVMMRMTIKPIKRERAKEAVKMFEASDYATSLRCLDKNVNQVAANILNKFHGDPARPELHSFHLTDFARKSVNIYSRLPEPDEGTRWLPYGKEAAIQALSKHVSTLLTYALERAAGQLKFKFCPRERVVCFCLEEKVLDKHVIIVDGNAFDEHEFGVTRTITAAMAGIMPSLRVIFYDGELTEIKQGYGYTAKAMELGQLINQRTGEVLEQLKDLVFTEADIMTFLERTRRPIDESPVLLLE